MPYANDSGVGCPFPQILQFIGVGDDATRIGVDVPFDDAGFPDFITEREHKGGVPVMNRQPGSFRIDCD
jgi:hypothetical protein